MVDFLFKISIVKLTKRGKIIMACCIFHNLCQDGMSSGGGGGGGGNF
jgi:hypothetical protein